MVLDDKTLRAIVASRPPEADVYCPKCGRLWVERAPDHLHAAAVLPWRAVLLQAVGLALVVAFGLQAARAYQRQAAIRNDLAVLTLCVSGVSGDITCPSMEVAESWLRMGYGDEAAARDQQDRAHVASALGLIALVVGLGSLARRNLWTRPPGNAPPVRSAIGAVGGALLAVTCFQVLVMVTYRVATQLAAGLPPTGQTFDRAALALLDAFSRVSGG